MRRLNRWWNSVAGADIAIRRMEAAEEKHEAEFREQRDRALAGEEDVQEFLRTERARRKSTRARVERDGAARRPRSALDAILKRERWHGRGGSWVADAIYGANDGLGAVFGIVSGVAGATDNQQHFVLISGLAGMLASTLSMGAGAYLAAKSEAEVYEAEISRERAEVEENPEEEIEEMALFYQLQGFSREESQRMAERLAEQPGTIRAGDGSERARLVRTSLSESVEIRDLSCNLYRDRRFCSDHSIFLLWAASRRHCRICDQSDRALRCGRREITHHHPFLVGVGSRNDVDRRDCRRGHLRARLLFGAAT